MFQMHQFFMNSMTKTSGTQQIFKLCSWRFYRKAKKIKYKCFPKMCKSFKKSLVHVLLFSQFSKLHIHLCAKYKTVTSSTLLTNSVGYFPKHDILICMTQGIGKGNWSTKRKTDMTFPKVIKWPMYKVFHWS